MKRSDTNRIKKAICALCVLSLAAAAGSCAQGSGEDVQTQPMGGTDSSLSADSEEPTVLKYINDLPEADFNGDPFRIYAVYPERYWDHFFIDEPDGEVINDMVYLRNTEVASRYNVVFETYDENWVTGPDTIRSLIRAGDDTYSLMIASHNRLSEILVGGYLLPWEMTSVDMTRPYYVKQANETFSMGGNTMLLFGDYTDSLINLTWAFAFNKRLAEDYDITGLYELVDEGKWTVDQFLTLIKGIYVDLNGDGKRGAEDFYGYLADDYPSIDAWSRPLMMSAVSKDEDDYPILDFLRESTVDAYTAVYEMYYNTPSIYHSFGAWGHIDTFAKGNSIFSSMMFSNIYDSSMRDMEDDYGVLPFPKLTEEMEYSTHLDGAFSALLLPTTLPASTLERTGIITEALNAYSGEYVRPAIYETTLKLKTTRDEESARMMDLILASRSFSFDSMDELNFPLSPICVLRDNIQKGTQSITSYYEKQNKRFTKRLEKLIKDFKESME